MSDRIDLAHAPPFALGELGVRPSTRELVTSDGVTEVVEPRVMQVLIALARADGAVVSRDDLTRMCWEGRVVGDDAINRVMSRLRKVAEGPGGGRFRVETVTRVGYRLVRDEAAVAPQASNQKRAPAPKTTRRALIGDGAAIVIAGGGIGWWRWNHPPAPRQPAPTPQVQRLMDQAQGALRQANPEGLMQGIGLLRRVVEVQPDYADAWGMLAGAYATAAHLRAADVSSEMEGRARAAAARADALDPGNPYAAVAMLALLPRMGHWWRTEQAALAGRARYPKAHVFEQSLGALYAQVGRMRESAAIMDLGAKMSDPSPTILYLHVQMLWAADRLEEADRAMDEAFALFPTHFAIWFTRFYLLLYTGRAGEALSFAQNVDGRPTGIPPENFEMVMAVARALISHAAADVDAAMKLNLAAAHSGAGFAENTIQYASALGRIDDAFLVANGYYLARGFAVGDLRFSQQQGAYTRLDDRRTQILFLPSTKAMRADPRFETLVREIGLSKYWAESHSVPDYKRP